MSTNDAAPAAGLKKEFADLKKSFGIFKSQRERVVAQVHEVRGRIKALQAEARTIKQSPVSCDDFADMLCVLITRQADEGRDRLRKMFTKHLPDRFGQSGPADYLMMNYGDFQFDKVQAVLDGAEYSGLSPKILCASDPSYANLDGKFDLVGMCTVLEEPMKAAIRANLKSFEWPYSAQTSESRITRLSEIEGELSIHREQENELLALLGDTDIEDV